MANSQPNCGCNVRTCHAPSLPSHHAPSCSCSPPYLTFFCFLSMRREVGVFPTLLERLPPPSAVCSFFVPVWEAAPPAPLHSAASILSLLASNPPASPSISRRTHGSFHRFHHAVRHRLAPAHATSQLRANLPLSTDSRVRYQAGAPPASLLSGQIQLGKNESQLVPVPDQ